MAIILIRVSWFKKVISFYLLEEDDEPIYSSLLYIGFLTATIVKLSSSIDIWGDNILPLPLPLGVLPVPPPIDENAIWKGTKAISFKTLWYTIFQLVI